MLIHLARLFEKGIIFQHGKAFDTNRTPIESNKTIDVFNNVSSSDEVGYLCYAYDGEKRVLFTPMSYVMVKYIALQKIPYNFDING